MALQETSRREDRAGRSGGGEGSGVEACRIAADARVVILDSIGADVVDTVQVWINEGLTPREVIGTIRGPVQFAGSIDWVHVIEALRSFKR